MHSAPSVVYPVVRSQRAGLLLLCAWLLGAVPVACWSWSVASPWFLRAGVLAWTLAIGAWTVRVWRRTPQRSLAWDGQSWRCDDRHGKTVLAEAQLSVALDFQSLMLLRLQPVRGRAGWVFADRAADPVRWHGLRCAVHGAVPAQPAQAEAVSA